jgi:hypothetical protein
MNRLIVLVVALFFCVILPVRAEIKDNSLPIDGEQLKNNPYLCTPVLGQEFVNGIVVDRVVGNNCQAYLNGKFNLEAVREQQETKREQIETQNKLFLFQYFVPRWTK